MSNSAEDLPLPETEDEAAELAYELEMIQEQLTALERIARKLESRIEGPPSAAIRAHIQDIAARAVPLQARADEILAIAAMWAFPYITMRPLYPMPALSNLLDIAAPAAAPIVAQELSAPAYGAGVQAELEFLATMEESRARESEAKHRPPSRPSTTPTGLIRDRYPERDFFLADMFDCSIKDDGVSMEVPIYTLATKPDLSLWSWVSKDGTRSIRVAPSVLGRATQHDKDVLIYVVSQITEALNRGREDAKNRAVRFTVHNYLVTTNRGVGGADYKELQESFERLAGTRITTDIKTGGTRVKEGFGLIDRWKIIEKSPTDDRMVAVEITLSEWLYNAVQANEVLTIHSDYFRLRKPIARRLYELARKHCGHQAQWSISLQLLLEKSGSRGTIYDFHDSLKEISEQDCLPQYRMKLSATRPVKDIKVTFYARDVRRVANSVLGTRAP